jgi:RNA polymerase sigma-70 factor, ECF subfamily
VNEQRRHIVYSHCLDVLHHEKEATTIANSIWEKNRVALERQPGDPSPDWIYREIVGEIIEKYGRSIYNTACFLTRNAELAEEVTQNVSLKIFRKLTQFKALRESSVSTWINKVIANEVLDMRRKKRVHRLDQFEWINPKLLEKSLRVHSNHQDVIGAIYAEELVASLQKEIREIIFLRAVVGCTFKEIGKALNMPACTAKTRLNRGLLIFLLHQPK